jgi:addiction module HigA family antidote
MLPTKRVTTHPGEILRELFLEPAGVPQRALAEHLGISPTRLNEIIRGKRRVTAETAWLLSQALGTSPEFWLNAQAAHDLTATRSKVRKVKRFKIEAA